MTLRRRLHPVLLLALLAAVRLGLAQEAERPPDANLVHPTAVVTAAVGDYTVAGLVTHLKTASAFKQGIALFPGHPGIMKLREQDGRPRFDLFGNFLVRSRRHWLDDETLVVVVDAPTDQWATFTQAFRAEPRYGADVAALLREVARRYGEVAWTFVGTSEGSISAFHAARLNPQLAQRVILTSSVFRPSRNGPGLSDVDWAELRSPLLWVHHEGDVCKYTLHADAREFAARSRSPLLTVRGGDAGRGDACGAYMPHGFVGLERETVLAMRTWVKTGQVPADVERP